MEHAKQKINPYNQFQLTDITDNLFIFEAKEGAVVSWQLPKN